MLHYYEQVVFFFIILNPPADQSCVRAPAIACVRYRGQRFRKERLFRFCVAPRRRCRRQSKGLVGIAQILAVTSLKLLQNSTTRGNVPWEERYHSGVWGNDFKASYVKFE